MSRILFDEGGYDCNFDIQMNINILGLGHWPAELQRNVMTKFWSMSLFLPAFLTLSVAAAQNAPTVSPVLAKPAPTDDAR